MCIRDRILVQRFGDILDGKRTWQKELAQSNLRPTLPDAVAGDITAAMPYRAMMNIINFIQAMDYVVPGFAATETLLYSPELKFYSKDVYKRQFLPRTLWCIWTFPRSSPSRCSAGGRLPPVPRRTSMSRMRNTCAAAG